MLQARVPIYVSARSCKPAKPRSTPFANSFFTDGSCHSSPVLINIADHHLHLNQLPNPETAFNIHTSQADHRDRGKRLRLPSCLLIETASNDAPALPVAPCSRRFRCRLATIRSELRNHRSVGGTSTSRHWRPAIYEAGSTLEWIVTPRENSALNDRSGSASFWW